MSKVSDQDRDDLTGPSGSGERIAKRLARAGVASRRDAERIIEAGRVAVNGRVVKSPAMNVEPDDEITLDGNPVTARERTRLWLFHKPSGYLTTNRDPEGRKTIFDILPQTLPRVITVGRLDLNTEGLLILTNDGGLARQLELPQTGWLRRYRVRAHGTVTQDKLDPLKDGIAVEGVLYGSVEAEFERQQGANAWMTVGIREGKNREVKKVLGAIGLDVNRLIRLSYGPFQLGDLAPGEVREIKSRVLREQLGEKLIEEAGCDFETPVAAPPKPKKGLETVDIIRRGKKKIVRKPGQVTDPDRDVFDPQKRLRPKQEDYKGRRPGDKTRKPYRKGSDSSGAKRSDDRRDRPNRDERPKRDDRPKREDRQNREDRPKREEGPKGENRPKREHRPKRDGFKPAGRGPKSSDKRGGDRPRGGKPGHAGRRRPV